MFVELWFLWHDPAEFASRFNILPVYCARSTWIPSPPRCSKLGHRGIRYLGRAWAGFLPVRCPPNRLGALEILALYHLKTMTFSILFVDACLFFVWFWAELQCLCITQTGSRTKSKVQRTHALTFMAHFSSCTCTCSSQHFFISDSVLVLPYPT